MGRTRAIHRRRGLGLAALAAAACLVLPAAPADANCNLIPSAVTELGSTLGKVDRPIASPGQTVTLSLDFACTPNAVGFRPTLASNLVRLVFEPPGSDLDPTRVTELPVAPLRVSDCGPSRCSTLAFVVPDTDDLLPPAGDQRGLVGPARIVVENAAGALLAVIDDLYQPTLSCSDQTPDPIFERFVVLPPPNALPAASASGDTVAVAMQAAVDAGGDLIVPIDYTGVLPSGNAGPLARILDATWDLPRFETDPTPIAFPDNGFDWIRSFSDVGRAIPPFLEIEGTGGSVSGSVDAAVSVLHLENDDGNGPIFDLTFRLIDGRGPVIINDPVQITIGGAVPLESLTTSADTAVFVVDEAAQGEDLDGDGRLESQIVQIKNVATGDSRNTGEAVTVVSFESVHKQALANNGSVIAYLQSEAASRVDLRPFGQETGDGDLLDDALRVYDAFGDRLSDTGVTLADALPRVNNRSLAVTDGDLVVFGSFEGDETPPTTELVSRATDDFPGNAGSFDPDLSEDGQEAVFYSSARGFLPESAYIYDETTFLSEISFDGTSGDLTATTRFDFDFDSWPLTLSSVFEVPVNVSLSGDDAYGNTVGGADFSIGNPVDGLFITSDGAGGSYYTCAPGTWPASCDPNSPPGSFAIGQLIVLEAIVPDANVLINTDVIGDPRARKPGNLSEWLVQILATVTDLDGQSFVAVDAYLSLRPIQPFIGQVYLRDRGADTLELVSRNAFGGAGTNYSWRPSVSGDGDVVAYTTAADTLTNEIDDNGVEDIVRWRRSDGTSEFVSYNVTLDQAGNGPSTLAAVSGDGSTIAFVTEATNLFPPAAPTDANGAGEDILIYDVASRTIVDRVAVPGPPAAQPNAPITTIDVSWDGNVVAFGSYDFAYDLPSTPVAAADVFRFDRTTREIVRVTKAYDGTASNADSGYGVSLGGDDGRYLAFSTDATNLIDDEGLGVVGRHVLVYDHETGELERIDRTTAGAIGDGAAEDPVMSRDGQRVAFRSDADNLRDGADAAATQVYLYDRVTNAIDVYSKGNDGEPQGAPGTSEVALSGDGYSVGWNSNDPGLVAGDANGDIHDIFVRGVELAQAPDLNGNGRGGDRVLRVFDADLETLAYRTNAQVQFERAAVAGGRVATLSAESALPTANPVEERLALVAGGVADETGDGLGDTTGIYGFILPGNGPGGPGQNGITRFHAEFDVSGIDVDRLQSARVRFYTVPSISSTQDARFYHVRPPFNGALDPSDFQRDERAVSGAPVLPPNASGFVEVDVTSEIVRVLNSGFTIYGIQARSANEAAVGWTTQFRTSLVNVANPVEQVPTLIVEEGGAVGANADADFDDDVVFVYDGGMDALSPLGLSGRDVKLSDRALCVIVAESDEGEDLNADEDMDDQILFVADLSSYPPDPVDTGLEATQVVASGPYCYFTEPERDGEDRTGDGDFTDEVVVAFDVTTGQLLHLMATVDADGNPLPAPQELAAEELVADEDWVAFRTCEADQGRDLNRDLDMVDCVMHVADTRTGEVDNTLRASERCTFAGCDPFFEPYRLIAETNQDTGQEVVTLSFVTFEPTQGGERSGEGCLPTSPSPSCDLTTDGDDLDYVVQVFNPASGQAQAIEVSPETTVAPFPTTTFEGDLIILQLPCEAVELDGVECDGEGAPETVTLVVPDSDGDGTFDTSNTGDDNCSEFNPDQADGDADGLGASCDPDTDPETNLETTTPDEELPGGEAKLCELTGDGVIDETDVDIVFGDRGQKARKSDPRDPDRDGRITVLDARDCVNRCTNPNCEPSSSGGLTSCGFLGIEALLALVPWWIRRRRTR